MVIPDNRKIEIARHYLTHLDLTQAQVAKHFAISVHAVSESMEYYKKLVKFKTAKEEEGWDPFELEGTPNEAHRFERLIKATDL